MAAKRYLCATDGDYLSRLSEPSRISRRLQGRPMSASECREFEANPFFQNAVRLRHWDDAAKDPEMPTPAVAHYEPLLNELALD